jgi:spore coat polysaccharide biosynthesis protein SpsF
MEKEFETEQESFWAGTFGDQYIARNKNDQLIASNLHLFGRALEGTTQIDSCIEFGANIGLNLRALQLMLPNLRCKGIEINANAASELRTLIGDGNVFEGSIFDYDSKEVYDMSLIKTVLIHINPDRLAEVFDKLYYSSKKYILIAEYYNPSPVEVNYRGHSKRLFKRDFAGEMLDRFSDLRLVNYGFSYHRDVQFPQDDISWFLLEKKQ